jgi:hypothetical protein
MDLKKTIQKYEKMGKHCSSSKKEALSRHDYHEAGRMETKMLMCDMITMDLKEIKDDNRAY